MSSRTRLWVDARTSSRRCRAVGDLSESRRAAADAVLLHYPVLLENESVIDQVAAAIERVVRELR